MWDKGGEDTLISCLKHFRTACVRIFKGDGAAEWMLLHWAARFQRRALQAAGLYPCRLIAAVAVISHLTVPRSHSLSLPCTTRHRLHPGKANANRYPVVQAGSFGLGAFQSCFVWNEQQHEFQDRVEMGFKLSHVHLPVRDPEAL